MRLFSLIFNHCARAAGEPILPTILHMQKKYEEHFFIGLALNMHRGERRRRAKRERKRVRREVNNDSWLFRPINRQIFCAKMPSAAASSFLDRKILRQETAFPHHGKPSLLLFLVRKLIRQRKNTSSSPSYSIYL